MSQQQRRQVTDSFGWTHVTKGRKNQRNLQFLLPTELKPTKVTKGLCIQKVDEKCKRYTRKWKESDCYTKLNHFLHQVVLASNGVIITNCVCLGLGSLTGTHSGVGENVDSWYQLVTLVSILETLRREYSHAANRSSSH